MDGGSATGTAGNKGPSIDQVQQDLKSLAGGPLQEMESMVGAEGMKRQFKRIMDQAINYRIKAEQGVTVKPERIPRNFVIEGNPGTGKTTVANALGAVLAATGITEKPEVAAIQGGALSGQYVNESRKLTQDFLRANRGKTILIDEAQQMATNKFGKEIADALLAFMNEEKDARTAIVLAGYGKDAHPTNNVDKVLGLDPGFQRRFDNRLQMPDYSPTERLDILGKIAEEDGITLNLSPKQMLQVVNDPGIQWEMENAGGVTRKFNEAIQNATSRYVESGGKSRDDILEPEDFGL